MLYAILIVLLIFAVLGAPVHPYSLNWGWYPSGGTGLIIIILLILLLSGRI